ncbi:hypothetical protein Tco_1177487 [Tanacetum coccineum]
MIKIHTSPFPTFANRQGTVKSLGNNDHAPNVQKKDVFRPFVLDNRGKELGDNRKVDRWTDNSSGKYYGEARRAPSKRLTDSGNNDGNHDPRCEGRWNPRWGPDGKETDGPHDKWTDSGKDEWDTDHPRPWTH